MGLATTLRGLSITPTERTYAAANATLGDPDAALALCQVKTAELLATLGSIVKALPAGNPNIATINALIATLT